MNLESSTVTTSVEAIRGELARSKVATTTLNLVVWIDDAERRDWILERTGLLSDKHPSFTLVLDNTGVCTQTTVTTGTRDPDVTVNVDAERVQIDVTDLNAESIASYVAMLCTSNVPRVLWWSGFKESSRATFYAILPLIDTLVVDSSGGTRDHSALGALAAFHAEHPEVSLRDLAWMRLRPWQDMIAQFFDDPNLRNELFTIRKLFIASGSESEALYLAGWLASRLGWRATALNAFTDDAGGRVEFVRRPEGDIRRVHSICLDTETSWYHGEVSEDAAVVRIWVEGEHARDARLFPLQSIDNASLLERAILQRGTDELFETALRSAATLLG